MVTLTRHRRKSTVDDDLLWLADIGVGRDNGSMKNDIEGLVDGQTAAIAVATLCYFRAEVYRNIMATITTIYEPISSTEAPPPLSPSPHHLANTPKGLENGDVRGNTRGKRRGIVVLSFQE